MYYLIGFSNYLRGNIVTYTFLCVFLIKECRDFYPQYSDKKRKAMRLAEEPSVTEPHCFISNPALLASRFPRSPYLRRTEASPSPNCVNI